MGIKLGWYIDILAAKQGADRAIAAAIFSKFRIRIVIEPLQHDAARDYDDSDK